MRDCGREEKEERERELETDGQIDRQTDKHSQTDGGIREEANLENPW